jgi:hypothetical protein
MPKVAGRLQTIGGVLCTEIGKMWVVKSVETRVRFVRARTLAEK